MTRPITLDPVQPELFDRVASEFATEWAEEGRRDKQATNKSAQIRRFYDEVVQLEQRARRVGDAGFRTQVLPFVMMLNAKAAYAKGRKLVGDGFVRFVRQGTEAVQSPATLATFRLLFEATLGFYKAQRPDD